MILDFTIPIQHLTILILNLQFQFQNSLSRFWYLTIMEFWIVRFQNLGLWFRSSDSRTSQFQPRNLEFWFSIIMIPIPDLSIPIPELNNSRIQNSDSRIQSSDSEILNSDSGIQNSNFWNFTFPEFRISKSSCQCCLLVW